MADGTGLKGEYFENFDDKGPVGSPKLTRIDKTVNFDWDWQSPGSGIDPQRFSVRWSGQVQAQYSETYTLYTASDDGVRLWVGGTLLIDQWHDQWLDDGKFTGGVPVEGIAGVHVGTIDLTAAKAYDIKMEYLQDRDRAVAKLYWSSKSTPTQIIPQSQLYSVVADSVRDFSGTQEKGGWIYGYYAGTFNSSGFTRMSQFTENSWLVNASAYWTSLSSQGGHPNAKQTSGGRKTENQWAVRRWRSNVGGPVVIDGRLAKANTAGGDGVTGHIFIDNEEVWSQSINANDSVGVNYKIEANLNVGSLIDFAIDPKVSDHYDSTIFTARIAQS